jgi:hypothetical protein
VECRAATNSETALLLTIPILMTALISAYIARLSSSQSLAVCRRMLLLPFSPYRPTFEARIIPNLPATLILQLTLPCP